MDGTQDDQANIREIEDHTMASAETKFTLLEDDEESGRESDFTVVGTNYSNDLTEYDSEVESDKMCS